jgi:predicted nuclease with TOPRIM domain
MGNFNYIRDLTLEERVRNCYQKSKKAIEYYTKHYPDEENYQPKKQSDTKPSISDNEKLIAENEQLKEQLAQCVSQLNELVKDNAKLKEKLAEFSESVEELTAEQKVRMAFTLELLKEAGLTPEVLDKNKSKVATIMYILTGIVSNNKKGYKAQICQNYLTDQKYYPRKENMETLLKLNTLCAELGIRVTLKMESQSNKKE